jgi:energy-converting hydrogenase Eha subunit G
MHLSSDMRMGVYADTGINPFYSYQSTTTVITAYLYSKRLQGFVVFEGTNKLEGVKWALWSKAI